MCEGVKASNGHGEFFQAVFVSLNFSFVCFAASERFERPFVLMSVVFCCCLLFIVCCMSVIVCCFCLLLVELSAGFATDFVIIVVSTKSGLDNEAAVVELIDASWRIPSLCRRPAGGFARRG